MKNAAVRIGRVRSGLVVHLAIHGTTCSSLRPVRVEVNERAATARLCKKCFTPERITRAQQANRKPINEVAANILCTIVEARRTPEERAASAVKFAETAFARDIAAANAPVIPIRRRTWAEIRADFHPTTEIAGQLELLPAAA